MFKRLFVVVLALAMAFVVSACGQSEQPSDNGQSGGSEGSQAVVGGWALFDNKACVLPEDVQVAFDKAYETYTGSELKPVAYVASQVVAGMNYMILCETATTTEAPSASYQMVVVYADLEGNARITQVNEFDLTAYTGESATEGSTEQHVGGWAVAEDRSSVVMPQEAKDAFDKAVENVDGNELEPMVLLGTQVVSGTNYAFLCFSTLQTDETINGIQVVTVYQDLSGNAEVTSVCAVDPADFNK